MATTSDAEDTLQEVLRQLTAMSNQFEVLKRDVDTLKRRSPTPAWSSSRESASGHTSRSSSESEDADGEQYSRGSSRSRANLTSHRRRHRSRSRASRSHRSRSRAARNHSSRSRASRSHRSRSRASRNHCSKGRRSPSRRPPTKRSWADRMEAGDDVMDYNAPVPWADSEEEDNPNLQEVSEETRRVLETSCLSRKSNSARLQVRNFYPLPKVTATRSLALDSYLKQELSAPVKQEDKELAKIQAFVLDALAPLTTILEETGGDQDSGVHQAAKAAVQLVGNASAKISHLRRKKVVGGLNTALLPLVEEDRNFTKAPPSLFGTEFAQKSKDHVDQVKAIRALPKQHRSLHREPFFEGAPPQAGGEAEADMAGRGEAEPTDPTAATTATTTGSSGGTTQPGLKEERTSRTTNSCKLYPNANTPSYQCFEQYPAQSITKQGYFPIERETPASWKAGPLFRELENSNKGPMGVEHGPGVPIRAPGRAHSEGSPTPFSVLCGTEQTDRGGGICPSREGGSVKGKSTKQRVLFQSLPGSQEGWRAEAGNKPQSPEPIPPASTLQNGGYTHPEGYNKARRLACQSGPQGCILHHPNTSTSQGTPEVQLSERGIPVQLSPIRADVGTLGLYQDPQASNSPPPGVGSKDGGLHRRHPDPCGDQGSIEKPGRSSGLSPRVHRVHYQPKEVNNEPHPVIRLFRLDDRYPVNDHKPTSREAEENPCRGTQDGTRRVSFSQGPGQTFGENECNSIRVASGSIVLPPLAEELVTSPRQQCPVLRDSGCTLAGEQRGAGVVGHTHEGLEWEDSPEKGDRSDHRLRRISDRLGSRMPGPKDRRPMVIGREADAHKLSGAACSYVGNSDICQRQERPLSPAEDRQYHSSSVHQQPWRHCLQESLGPIQEPVDVVPGEEYPHHSATPPRNPERGGGHGVQGDDRPVRLETEPGNLLEDQSGYGPRADRPVCNQADNPVPTLFQLAARSLCRGHRCIPAGLVTGKGLCQPTMESGGESAGARPVPTSPGGAGGTCLEDTAMVSPVTVNASSVPTSDQASSRGHSSPHPACTRHTASRLEHLRQRYREQELSENATSLMLGSWRAKTNKAYDSLFTKWRGWCSEWDADPFSGPITNVVNFLASLHSEGYQYNSINSYRSAISSVHEKVDGYSIGQHPLVTKLLKGVFHDRPPLPRYTATWKVDAVLTHLGSLGSNENLSLKQLTWKTTMLLALTRPSRSADLSNLDITGRQYRPEGVAFLPCTLAKQSRQGKPIAEFFFPSFPHDTTLCPVTTLRAYEERTRDLRAKETRLFVSLIKPHNKVSSSTIARWIKSFLETAGVDTTIFQAHSVRGASSSTAANMGITTNDILKAADWSSESVFQKFYYKATQSPSFGRAVLSSGSK